MKRSATAVWNGSGKDGQGTITSQSKILDKISYTTRTRFDVAEGTSPEELLAAAHAACFNMKLSFVIDEAGSTAESIETTCTITVEDFVINNSHMVVKAKVPGMLNEKFQEAAEDARKNCPVSQLFNTKITMDAQLL
jgi:osmotically inducible protein OsmC